MIVTVVIVTLESGLSRVVVIAVVDVVGCDDGCGGSCRYGCSVVVVGVVVGL